MAKTCRAFHTMGCVACESLHFPSKALLCASNFTATATHATRESELEVEGLIDRLERNCSFNSTVQRWLLMQGRHRECAILPQCAFLHASADEKQIRRKFGLFAQRNKIFLPIPSGSRGIPVPARAFFPTPIELSLSLSISVHSPDNIWELRNLARAGCRLQNFMKSSG